MAPNTMVRVYSGQHPDALKIAKERGYITGSVEHIEPEYLDAYNWMRDQMNIRIPEFSGDYPLWSWLKRQSWKKRERRVTGFADKNVRVTALIPRKRMLLSDYDVWHMPLNNSPIAESDEEWESHYHENGNEVSNEAIRRRWPEIFVLDRPKHDLPDDWKLGHTSIVQACIDRIYVNEIVSVAE